MNRASPDGGSHDPAVRTLRWRYLPLPSALADLRHRVRTALAQWGIVGGAAEEVVLVVSELATNAIEHAYTPLLVALGLDRDGVQIRVRDYSADPPMLRSPDEDSLRGWGLRLLDELAVWGWIPHPDGKTVWATVERPTRRLRSVPPLNGSLLTN